MGDFMTCKNPFDKFFMVSLSKDYASSVFPPPSREHCAFLTHSNYSNFLTYLRFHRIDSIDFIDIHTRTNYVR